MGADSRDDRILRLLTEDDQLLPVIARGARRATRKGSFSARLQPLSLVRVVIASTPRDDSPGGESRPSEWNLATVTSAETVRPLAIVKADLMRTALASAMAEVVLHIVPEEAREEGLYELVCRAMFHLDDPAITPREEIFLLFLLRVLDQQGILPPLDELPELSTSARDTLEQWRVGRFAKLEVRDRQHTSRFLERALTAFSGRPLMSRSLIDACL
jgi:DNA repair protein RecO